MNEQRVFISYSRKNSDIAEKVTGLLKGAGLEVWIDKEGIPGGAAWQQTIDDAIWGCFALVVIMTPDVKDSEWVTYEWIFALGARKEVIPLWVDIEPNDLHERMRGLKGLDFNNVEDHGRLLKKLAELKVNSHSNVYLPPDTPPDIQNLFHEALDSGADHKRIKDRLQRLADMEEPHREFNHRKIAGMLKHHDPVVSRAVLETMASKRIGELEDIPSLVSFLRKDSNAQTAIRVITQIFSSAAGLEAIDQLFSLLNDPDEQARRQICDVLGLVGGEAVIPGIQLAMQDNAPSVRRDAIRAVGRIVDSGISSEDIQWILIEALADEEFAVYQTAQEILIKLGGIVVEKLVDVLKEGDSRAKPIRGILTQKRTHRVVELVCPLLQHSNATVRQSATMILHGADNLSQDILSTFIDNLNDENKDVRLETISIFARKEIFSRTPEALGKFIHLASHDEDTQIQSAAADVLRQQDHPDAQKAYQEWLERKRKDK